jgi:hypothetical protein
MAGYEVPQDTIKLKFSDPSFEGLEVVCHSVPYGNLTETAEMAKIDPKNVTDEDLERVDRLVKAFSDNLVSWNLTREGKKVPVTNAGVKSLNLVFLLQIVEGWLQGTAELVATQAQKDSELAETLSMDALG